MVGFIKGITNHCYILNIQALGLVVSEKKHCSCYSYYQRTNGPVNAHLISGPNVSTKTMFTNFDIVLKWVKVNPGSSFI